MTSLRSQEGWESFHLKGGGTESHCFRQVGPINTPHECATTMLYTFQRVGTYIKTLGGIRKQC